MSNLLLLLLLFPIEILLNVHGTPVPDYFYDFMEDGLRITRAMLLKDYALDTEILDLDNLNIETIEEDSFLDFRSVQVVKLNVNPQLRHLPEGLFRNLNQVKVIDLSNTFICELNFAMYWNLPRLEQLLLSNSCKDQVFKIRNDARNAFVELKMLDLSENHVENLDKLLNEADLSMLQELDLTACSIQHLKSNAFDGLINLRRLQLKGNNLPRIDACLLKSLQKLEYLDMSFCHVEHVQFPVLSSLKSLILNSNKLKKFDFKLKKHFKKLNVLELGSNELKFLREDLFENSDSLEVLDLSNNQFEEIPSALLRPLLSLKVLKLSHIGLAALDAELPKHENLQELVLSDNLIDFIEPNVFTNLNKLKTLNLSNNQLTDLDKDAFSSLESIESIDLRKNNLKSLDLGIFAELNNLKHVWVANTTSIERPLTSKEESNPLQVNVEDEEKEESIYESLTSMLHEKKKSLSIIERVMRSLD